MNGHRTLRLFLADRTVTQYDPLLVSTIMSSDYPSVMLRIVALRVSVDGQNLYRSVHRLATNHTETNEQTKIRRMLDG